MAFFTNLFQFYGRCDSDKAPKLGHLRGLTGNANVAKYNTYYCFSLLLPKNHKMINLMILMNLMNLLPVIPKTFTRFGSIFISVV